jgi:hypothetical protein
MQSNNNTLSLVNNGVSAPAWRRILPRLFRSTGDDGTHDPFTELEVSHALSKRKVELDADLDVHEHKSVLYRRLKTLETDAAFEVARVVKCRELCAQVDQLLHDEPVEAELLKVRIRAILNEQESQQSTLWGE